MMQTESSNNNKKNADEARQFPINGVIGVVAESEDEIAQAIKSGLSCIELRVDLLLSGGSTVATALDMVAKARRTELTVLVTVRHPSHGGKFDGTESERVSLCKQLIDAGANIVDVEWDSEAATLLQNDSMDLILSYHNFESMISATELEQLTHEVEARGARAIKVVPTAKSVADAAAILSWVEQSHKTGQSSDSNNGSEHRIERIGFAMGEQGACSRVLTTAFGGAITYASFGAPVAPGQIDLNEMLDNYQVPLLNESTRVTAVIEPNNDSVKLNGKVATLNQEYAADQIDTNSMTNVAIGFDKEQLKALEKHKELMRIDKIIQL